MAVVSASMFPVSINAALCPRMRHFDLRIGVDSISQPLRLPRVVSARLRSPAAWRRIDQLLDSGADSIEIGPGQATFDPFERRDEDTSGAYTVAWLLRAMHEAMPSFTTRRPQFHEMFDLCAQLGLALVEKSFDHVRIVETFLGLIKQMLALLEDDIVMEKIETASSSPGPFLVRVASL